jgi:SAM-dependent methyltransferase
MLKLYNELASWWPLLSSPDEYADEAEVYWQIFSHAGLPPAPTLLELGCGGGNNASHLKKYFPQMTLTDLSPGMLAVSRALNPECEHLLGDMRHLRLGRTFDVVFLADAVAYLINPYDLQQTMATAFLHCKEGGVALFVPDHVCENFKPYTDHGGHDGDGRALRYLEWTYDPDPSDTQYTSEFAYLLREGDQPARVESEQHLCGLFPRSDWLRWLREAGFLPEVIPDPFGRDMFFARKSPG